MEPAESGRSERYIILLHLDRAVNRRGFSFVEDPVWRTGSSKPLKKA